MPRTVGLVQLHFHAGLDFMNLDSPVGSCFKQFLVDICDTVPCDYMLAGPYLDDPEKALVMICYGTASESDIRSALHPTLPAYASLTPHLQSPPRADAFCFVKPPTPNFGQCRERVQELALLRFPNRHFDDIGSEIADDHSPFGAGLWHVDVFFSDARCSNAHKGPADLAHHYQGVAPGDPERGRGTGVLHAWSWVSEAAMMRFKDSAQPNYYSRVERDRADDEEPDDLWQTGFLKEIEDLRESGADVSVFAVKLQQFSPITKRLGYI